MFSKSKNNKQDNLNSDAFNDWAASGVDNNAPSSSSSNTLPSSSGFFSTLNQHSGNPLSGAPSMLTSSSSGLSGSSPGGLFAAAQPDNMPQNPFSSMMSSSDVGPMMSGAAGGNSTLGGATSSSGAAAGSTAFASASVVGLNHDTDSYSSTSSYENDDRDQLLRGSSTHGATTGMGGANAANLDSFMDAGEGASIRGTMSARDQLLASDDDDDYAGPTSAVDKSAMSTAAASRKIRGNQGESTLGAASSSLASLLAASNPSLSVNINKISLHQYDYDDEMYDIKQVIVRDSNVFVVTPRGFDVFHDELLVRSCKLPSAEELNQQQQSLSKSSSSGNRKSQRQSSNNESAAPKDVLEKIFVDPNSTHILLSCRGGRNFYFNMTWSSREKIPRLIEKLSQTQIESVAWHKDRENSDGIPVLIGTRDSKIYEVSLRDAINPVGDSTNLRFDFTGRTDDDEGAITAIAIESGPYQRRPEDERLVILVCTEKGKIFSFTGGPTPSHIFEYYKDEQTLMYKEFSAHSILEGPDGASRTPTSGAMGHHDYNNADPEDSSFSSRSTSQLATFYGLQDDAARSFAWLCPAGVFHGPIDYHNLEESSNPIPEVEIIKWDQKNPSAISMTITEHHLFLLTEDKVSVYMQPSNLLNAPPNAVNVPEVSFSSVRKVYEKSFDKKVEGTPLGLAYDPFMGVVYVYTNSTVFYVNIEDEERDVWILYLKRAIDPRTSKHEHFEAAERLVREHPANKNLVLTERANFLFNEGLYFEAAGLYEQTHISFEEIAMKFASHNQFDALREYLTKKLTHMKRYRDAQNVATQLTCLCTWLTELFVSKLDDLIAEERIRKEEIKIVSNGVEGDEPPSLNDVDDRLSFTSEDDDDVETYMEESEQPALSPLETLRLEFHEFLDENQEHVNKITTFRIIESHGHMEEVLYFAELILEFKRVISHHIVSRNYRAALEILESKCRSSRFEDHFYMFAPVLMQHYPKETVHVLMKKKFLDPGKLIPSLMRYKMHPSFSQAQRDEQENYIIEYLHWCIIVNENRDPAIHNLLLAMYAQQDEDEKLLAMLETEPHYFDPKYALRICQQYDKVQACVQLYISMDLQEDAVQLALKNKDIDLARECVESLQHSDSRRFSSGGDATDEQRVKRLWKMIAQHIIEFSKNDENNIQRAIAFLDTTEVLKLEDILPLFPDFKQIKNYRDIIVKSLEDHKSEIENLKHQMEDANDSSTLIRKDIDNLKHRCNVVDANTPRCCSSSCVQPLVAQDFYMFPCGHMYHTKCLVYDLRKSCSSIMRQRIDELLAELKQKETRTHAQVSLDNMISQECLLCGDYMMNVIDARFIGPGDVQESKKWALTTRGGVGSDDDDSDYFEETSFDSASSDDSIYISDQDW